MAGGGGGSCWTLLRNSQIKWELDRTMFEGPASFGEGRVPTGECLAGSHLCVRGLVVPYTYKGGQRRRLFARDESHGGLWAI